ncbi:hypothetical protein ACF1BE_25255 [Streptomyces sp. NPDC014991]|uniref:hypothetical protein n=1 Tax=Streptomyces sp. NPDC014991 TaxID=3364935 RepID=UPI0036F9A6C3
MHAPFPAPSEPRFVPRGEHPLRDEALAAVNQDLAVTLPDQRPLCLVAWPGEPEEEAERVHVALADGDAHGNPLEPSSTAAEALLAVAGAAQDTVMECLWLAWPVCTLHGLGMHLAEVAGRPSWWCGGTDGPDGPGHVRAAVGEMDTVHRPRRPNSRRREERTPLRPH